MFQTFTGNSRRPRQVNLSGRTNNPFATVPSPGTSKAPGGGSGAIAHAQLERKARQQERDRLQASRKLQRVWRGHQARKKLRNQLLEELLASEQRLSALGPRQRSYNDVWQHLRLCVQAVRPHAQDPDGLQRLLTAGHWLCEKEKDFLLAQQAVHTGSHLSAPLRALLWLLLRFLDTVLFDVRIANKDAEPRSGDAVREQWVNDTLLLLAASLKLLSFIAAKELHGLEFRIKDILASGISGTKVLAVEQYYRVLGLASQKGYISGSNAATAEIQHRREVECSILATPHVAEEGPQGLLRGLLLAPGGISDRRGSSYRALLRGLLTRSGLSETLLLCLRNILDLEFFLGIASDLLQGHGEALSSELTGGDNQALLSNIIHLCNQTSVASHSPDNDSTTDSFSVNLGFLSILTQVLQNYGTVADLDPATHEQLRRLVQPDNIAALFKSTDWITTTHGQKDDAHVLADYILTIIRLLPSKADEVRMWIYLSSSGDSKGRGTHGKSALRLFWSAVAMSDIFNRSCASARDAAELLPERRGQSGEAVSASNSSGWNTILLFMELYSFALRIQDDEQLVNGLDDETNGKQPGASTLKLAEMKALVTFLKNVSYAIYTGRNILADSATKDSLVAEKPVGQRTGPASWEYSGPRQSTKATARSISMSQLKGTATALLRTIYERDSRRRFLPRQHFIMEELENANFINDVIREQELRAQLEQEVEDSDEDTEMPDWDSRRSAEREVMVSSHTLQVQRHTRQAQMRQRQSKRYLLQRAAPRVEILENIPFLVPFETRIIIFRSQVENDMLHRREGNLDPDMWRMNMAARHPGEIQGTLGAHSAELRRERVFEDAFKAFYKLGDGLKEPIKISFIGEEGIDGGGVTKEFLTSIIDEVFSIHSEHRLFAENDQHELYPYPSALDEIDVYFKNASVSGQMLDQEKIRQAKREKLQFYEFVGRVVGKCLYEGILVQIPLARFFIAKWALTGGDGASRNESTFRPSINDLRDYDQDIYRSMLTIKNYTGDVGEWGIDFSVTDDVGGGETLDRELRPGGSNTPVDNANRLIYIALITKHYLMDRQGPQTRAFLDGLSSIIKPTWLRMFNEAEIRTLLGGEAKPIDVEDLRRNTVYGGVYQVGDDGQEHPTIKMFWEVMHEMQDVDRRKLLQYATSTPNAPLMGFSHLNPRFSIRDSMSDQGRLPTSSTCANLLKLPIYKTKQNLHDKIMTAIHSNAGFDLS